MLWLCDGTDCGGEVVSGKKVNDSRCEKMLMREIKRAAGEGISKMLGRMEILDAVRWRGRHLS